MPQKDNGSELASRQDLERVAARVEEPNPQGEADAFLEALLELTRMPDTEHRTVIKGRQYVASDLKTERIVAE